MKNKWTHKRIVHRNEMLVKHAILNGWQGKNLFEILDDFLHKYKGIYLPYTKSNN